MALAVRLLFPSASSLHSFTLIALPSVSPPAITQLKYLTLPPSGLDFTAQALRHNLNNSDKELDVSFRAAYGDTLKPHHGFMVKPIFSAAMSAAPYKKDFYKKLGSEDSRFNQQLEDWLAALENNMTILKEFLARKEAKW
jgi:hypothetical protein